MPKLSIITVNLNNFGGLKMTVDSVFDQVFTDYEFIVIDGGSVDGSSELIAERANKLTYWVSEPDTGIYNAMNKGILRARGEYLLFLNSGDILCDKEALKNLFDLDFCEDVVYWNLVNNLNKLNIVYPDQLRFSFFLKQTIVHQSCILKRDLFKHFGLYNEALRIVSDWEFFIKTIFIHNVSTRHLQIVVVQYDFADGLSKRPEMIAIIENERQGVLEKYFSGFLQDYKDLEDYRTNLFNRLDSSLKVNMHFVKLARKLRKILNYCFN